MTELEQINCLTGEFMDCVREIEGDETVATSSDPTSDSKSIAIRFGLAPLDPDRVRAKILEESAGLSALVLEVR